MQSETQKNWNDYFNNKYRKRSRPPYRLLRYVVLVLAIGIFVYIIKMDHTDKSSDIARKITNTFDSSYNGIKMAGMINDVSSIVNKNTEYMNMLVSCSNKKKPMEQAVIKEWGELIAESESCVENLDYHASYEEYILTCKNMLAETRNLMEERLVNNKNDTSHINIAEAVLRINEYAARTSSELVKAFRKNGIEYSVTEDGIGYQYEVK